MASLYFLEKYDVMLAIVVVLLTVFDKTVFVLFRCYVLIVLIAWRVLNWHHVGVFLSIDWPFSQFLQCILARRNKIFYTLAELNEWRSSIFRFLKICAIFLGGLKIIRILCLFHILLIRSIVPLTYGRMDRILSSDCVSKTVVLFAYLLIVLIMPFLSCPFFCKAVSKWLSSVCRCSLSEIVKALCISKLIADFLCWMMVWFDFSKHQQVLTSQWHLERSQRERLSVK